MEKPLMIFDKYMGYARKILEGRLKLRINEEKMTRGIIIYSGKFKFIEFCIGKMKENIHKVHKKSISKAKMKLKRLKGRNQSNNPLY